MKHDHTQFSVAQDLPKRMSLPPILIARPDQTYVSVARYKRELERYGGRQNSDGLKLLFRLPSGDGYGQAREMSELDAIKGTAHLKRALEEAGLPALYAESPKHIVPVVMAQVEDDLFVSGAPGNIAHESVFIERTSRNSPSGTGSLMRLQAHQRYRPREVLSAKQMRMLGSWPGRCDLQGEGFCSGARNVSASASDETLPCDPE